MLRLLVSLLGLALLASGGQAAAQATPSVFVDPAEQIVALTGGNFEVRLMVDGVTNEEGLGGYTLAMAYDPSVVHGVSITDSGFVESTENPVTCPASAIDNDKGQLAHFCFTIPIIPLPGPLASEPQVLATVTFEPVGEGTTVLDISESSINDPQGNALAAATANGHVTVGETAAGPGSSETAQGPSSETSPEADAAADATAPDGLPKAGTADEGSDRTVLFVVSLLIGLAGLASVGLLLVLRARKRAA